MIPARQAIIATGKTILCSQIAFAQAAAGTRVVLATVASESEDKLIEELTVESEAERGSTLPLNVPRKPDADASPNVTY